MKLIRVGSIAFNPDHLIRATMENDKLKLDMSREGITINMTGETAKKLWNLLVEDVQTIDLLPPPIGGGKTKK